MCASMLANCLFMKIWRAFEKKSSTDTQSLWEQGITLWRQE